MRKAKQLQPVDSFLNVSQRPAEAATRSQLAFADRRQSSTQLRQLALLANGGPRSAAQRRVSQLAVRHDVAGAAARVGQGPVVAPVQAVSFSRRWSSLYWTDAEWEIDRKERKAREFQVEMRPYAVRFPEITQFGVELNTIRDTAIAADRMEAVLGRLNAIQNRMDAIATDIARVGMLAGDDVMHAYAKNTADSKTGRITQIIVNTIGMLPKVFRSPENNGTIGGALHPDIDNKGVGLKDEWLGESDVSFARMRQAQIVDNLNALENKIRGDWGKLNQKFGLVGTLKYVKLTGSDLHKGGQQVVIVESSGGQKVVYKPRSVAPDAALLDSEDGVFASLNEMGAELPTMGFLAAGEHAGYAEFVQHVPLKTVEQIKKHYRQMGQLVVAAKLFGVNDLHYENIMAAGRGPTIIDAETSFLLNVLTARDFQSNELQDGLFTHVSQIDSKLSNNSFHTAAEKTDWDDLGEGNRPGWDSFIGAKRDADVKKGGPYEADLKSGVTQLLGILKTNRVKIEKMTTERVDALEEVRVVPIGTMIFKQLMSNYRDHARTNNEGGMDDAIDNCCNQVCESLIEKGYRIQRKAGIRARIAEDFGRGDIPVLHYNGKTRNLVWNERVVGSFGDKRATKKPVGENIKWLVTGTAEKVLNSLQG